MSRRLVVLMTTALLAAACGGSGGSPAPSYPASIGATEGALSLVAWAGYVENGSTSPDVDWVTPFEKATGCKVSVTTGGTSNEMVQLIQKGEYDGVSASGNASLRLIASGDAAPVNVDLVPNYKDVIPALKDQPYNTVKGVHYGIPHGRGANVLAWRTDLVNPAPTKWADIFDPSSPYKGKISVYDDPIYIADAAIVLMKTRPDLKITNPYELDDAQFKAAVELLKGQRPLIGEYWTDASKQIQAITSGTLVAGTTWQYQVNTMVGASPAVPVSAILPEEGSSGWSDTWMVYSKAKHPNCMYKWLDWVISPDVNAQIAVYWGEAPSNAKSCAIADAASPGHCATFHAQDEAYFDRVFEWTVPQADCGDSRGKVCKDYSEWLKAWTEIKG